ncbi:11630_t:CDS:2, partial [Dentiscutata erythropus]
SPQFNGSDLNLTYRQIVTSSRNEQNQQLNQSISHPMPQNNHSTREVVVIVAPDLASAIRELSKHLQL